MVDVISLNQVQDRKCRITARNAWWLFVLDLWLKTSKATRTLDWLVVEGTSGWGSSSSRVRAVFEVIAIIMEVRESSHLDILNVLSAPIICSLHFDRDLLASVTMMEQEKGEKSESKV